MGYLLTQEMALPFTWGTIPAPGWTCVLQLVGASAASSRLRSELLGGRALSSDHRWWDLFRPLVRKRVEASGEDWIQDDLIKTPESNFR